MRILASFELTAVPAGGPDLTASHRNNAGGNAGTGGRQAASRVRYFQERDCLEALHVL